MALVAMVGNNREGSLHQAVLSDAEQSLLRDMQHLLAGEIAAAGGALPFDRYMERGCRRA